MAARQRGTPLWITFGCGCVFLVALAIAAVVAAGYFGVSAFKGYVEDMMDPASRGVKAGEILGASRLPEGYSAQLFLRVPWLLGLVPPLGRRTRTRPWPTMLSRLCARRPAAAPAPSDPCLDAWTHATPWEHSTQLAKPCGGR